MREIKDMSVLITGASSGIGEGAAEHFVRRGALVTITGRREDRLRAVADRLGDRCRPVVSDVTVAADRTRMVNEAVEHGGGLEALISNAGKMYRSSVPELDEQQLLDVFNTNVVAGMMLIREAHDHLVQSKGCVIFIGSVHTQRAFPGASPYAATKGGLEAVTGVLAAELGVDDIRVGCVRPGGVLTEINVSAGIATPEEAAARAESMGSMHALGRGGTTEEIAEAFEYLVRAEWTTGNVMTVDGGLGLGVSYD